MAVQVLSVVNFQNLILENQIKWQLQLLVKCFCMEQFSNQIAWIVILSKYLAKQNYYLTLSAHKLHKLKLSCGLDSKLNDFFGICMAINQYPTNKGTLQSIQHLLTYSTLPYSSNKSCNNLSLFNVTCQQCIIEGLKMG